MESQLKADGKTFQDCILSELEKYWQESKKWEN